MDASLTPDTRTSPAHPGGTAIFAGAVATAVLVPVLMYGVIALFLRGVAPSTGYILTCLACLVLLGIALWAMRSSGISLAAIGLTPSKAVEALAMALAVWGLYALLMLPLLIAEKPGLAEIFQFSPMQILQQWLFVGVAEEILFRGYILTWLRNHFTKWGKTRAIILAALVSSLIFSLYHIPARLFQFWQGKMGIYVVGYSLFLLILMGLLFAYVYLRTGNIFFAALVHGGSNCRLIGPTSDVFPLFVLIVAIELVHFFRARARNRQIIQA